VHFKLAEPAQPRPRDEIGPLDSHHHHTWNLHSVWDTGLIDVALDRDYNHSQPEMEMALLHELKHHKNIADYLECDPALGANRTCTVQWGQESWEAAIHFAYTLEDNQTDVTDGATLDESYYETRWPLAKARLLAGAVRLAGTLEHIVKSRSTAAANNFNKKGIAVAASATDASRRSVFFRMFSWLV
jgi:S1/P1 Nuclease